MAYQELPRPLHRSTSRVSDLKKNRRLLYDLVHCVNLWLVSLALLAIVARRGP